MRKEQWSSGEPLGNGPPMATAPASTAPLRKALSERELMWMMALLMARADDDVGVHALAGGAACCQDPTDERK